MNVYISFRKNTYFRYAVSIILILFTFFLSVYLFPYYTGGDQEHYRKVYSEIPKSSLIDGFRFYNENLSSYEVVHFLVVWLFSSFVEKDILMSFFNALLALVIVRFMERRNVSLLVTSVLIISNYYLFVNFFSAERLKFGLISFMLYMNFTNRSYSIVLSLLAVFSHIQFLIIYFSLLVKGFIERFLYFISTGLVHKNTLLYVLVILFSLYAVKEQLYIKFIAYYSLGSIENIYKLLIFLILALFYGGFRKIIFFIFLPLLASAFILGDGRLNIFGYFIFMYYALQVNRGVNVGVLLTSAYYSYKTYGFCLMLLEYGDPFYLYGAY